MALKFDMRWRFSPPGTGIPDLAVQEFLSLAKTVATQGDRQSVLETFKSYFSMATDRTHYQSSSVGWAESDLQSMMHEAAQNAPRFIEAYCDACEAIRGRAPDWTVPDHEIVNLLLQRHQVGFEVHPPSTLVWAPPGASALVGVPSRPPTLAEQAQEIFQQSIQRSEQSLSAGSGREAVQELLWLLESITTAFRGVETTSGKVEGSYFNQIVRDLKSKNRGTALERALEWATSLHGYLSSPTGGGVRHGLDLNTGVAMNAHEARLYANLIRSYLTYLLAEHEAMIRTKSPWL